MRTLQTVGEMIAEHHFRDAMNNAAEAARSYNQTFVGRAIRSLISSLENACMLEAQEHVSLSKQATAWERVDECERTLRSVIDRAIREAGGGR